MVRQGGYDNALRHNRQRRSPNDPYALVYAPCSGRPGLGRRHVLRLDDSRPAAVAALEAPARLGLWLEVFRRFFHWVWAAVILLPISGVGMLHLSFNGFAGAPRYVQVMMGLYVAMLALFLRVQALQVPELRRAVQAQDWPAGGQALGRSAAPSASTCSSACC